jgi:hypothetical protein
MQPAADVPGATGSVWMLGFFPGYEWRWVTVNAATTGGAPPAGPKK